jgi:hypothetical protein
MLAGMFAAKKRAACFNDAAHEQKGVVPAVASRTSPASHNRPSAGGKADFAPRPLADRSTSGDSKQGGRFARSPCRTIRQIVTDWPEEPSPAMIPPPGTPCRCSQPKPSCGDGDDDAWWWSATNLPQVPPCWSQPQALPCSARPLGPVQMPASPSRWRRKLRRGLIGCASYSWISLIGAALNGSQCDY